MTKNTVQAFVKVSNSQKASNHQLLKMPVKSTNPDRLRETMTSVNPLFFSDILAFHNLSGFWQAK